MNRKKAWGMSYRQPKPEAADHELPESRIKYGAVERLDHFEPSEIEKRIQQCLNKNNQNYGY